LFIFKKTKNFGLPELIWEKELVNPIAPYEAMISNDGKYVIFDAGAAINVVIADEVSRIKGGAPKRKQTSHLLDCGTCYPTRSIIKFENLTPECSLFEVVEKLVDGFYND
jgi:hypothetical protein